ncbi:hypothetical protein SAMIE_1015560 [Sphingobium amiense]|uniref:Uncharacterized protein n=1 Tax=Sphingobium amiense TaxID=135719 RepID=A0A494WC11_9SPHN|nr:hypothetical protein [Sphingobium amiense]BBD98055.1 hypothetical protein SAMIE_1015560 [Sphingobium amiense]
MIAWDILNSLARLMIAAILIWKLIRFPALFNAWERYGMSVAAGCSILTVTVIWEAQRSPFDGWATSLFSLGILLYFIGRATRHFRHQQRNEQFAREGIRRE